MVSFDEFKDVCVPTATNSDGEQICMYVCCPSLISSYYQVAYFFGSVTKGSVWIVFNVSNFWIRVY